MLSLEKKTKKGRVHPRVVFLVVTSSGPNGKLPSLQSDGSMSRNFFLEYLKKIFILKTKRFLFVWTYHKDKYPSFVYKRRPHPSQVEDLKNVGINLTIMMVEEGRCQKKDSKTT